MSNTLLVEVDAESVRQMKPAGYTLCIGKFLKDSDPNVIWSGTDFTQLNTLHWTEQYQIFGTNSFEPGDLVSPVTPAVDIGSGQTCTIDKDGIIGPAQGTVDKSGNLFVQNNYQRIHIGANCSITPPGSSDAKFQPFHVSPEVEHNARLELKTIDKVKVWFEQTGKTATILDVSRLPVTATAEDNIVTASIVVDFTGTAASSQTVSYNNGNWSDGSLREKKDTI